MFKDLTQFTLAILIVVTVGLSVTALLAIAGGYEHIAQVGR